jgi:hypothetical protein
MTTELLFAPKAVTAAVLVPLPPLSLMLTKLLFAPKTVSPFPYGFPNESVAEVADTERSNVLAAAE